MDRTYRAANGIYGYVVLLAAATAILGWEAAVRLRAGEALAGAALAALAVLWGAVALVLALRWGRYRVTVRHDALLVRGDGPARRLPWADVDSVREVHGPAYELSQRNLLPGPYLPHALLRGETVLELVTQSTMQVVLRQALLEGYPA